MKPTVQTAGAVIVSAIVTLGFVGLCVSMIFRPIADNPIAEVMFGSLSSGFTLVIGYWMGSSSGSHAKDSQIATLVQGQDAVTGNA